MIAKVLSPTIPHTDEDDIDPLTAMFAETTAPMENLVLAFCPLMAKSSPSYAEEMNGPNKNEFIKAIAREYASIKEHKVFSPPCELPNGKTALGTKMLLKIKETASAQDDMDFKARLCVKGFKRIEGVDYHEAYLPVAAFNSLRLFVDLMAKIDYEMDNIDVKTAFLYASLNEEVYIKIPDGYPNASVLRKEGKVLRLLKTLFALQQAPNERNKDLDEKLTSLDFQSLRTEPCIYVEKNSKENLLHSSVCGRSHSKYSK